MSSEIRLKTRDSNCELARIVAMMMIVIGHFVVHGMWEGEFCSIANMSSPWRCISENLLYSFCVCGVNIFVLISGYYTIKISVKSYLSLWCLCAFYGMIAFLVRSESFNTIAFIKSLMISNSQWFFKAYLWLFLISPIINLAIANMTIDILRRSVVFLVILNCVSGWILNNGNEHGYNVLQLIFMYFVGAWIKKDVVLEKISMSACFFMFICTSVLLFILSILFLYLEIGSNWIIYYYNNPIVVFASVTIFLVFSKIQIQSRAINKFASTVVAALFIQDMVAPELIYTSVNKAYNSDILSTIIYCIGWFLAIFLFAFIIESIRKRTLQPLIDWLSNTIVRIYEKCTIRS